MAPAFTVTVPRMVPPDPPPPVVRMPPLSTVPPEYVFCVEKARVPVLPW
ncbi:MAG: hypothetical protein U1F77_15805 [Kiritimatiellia bacterium]